MKRVMNCRGGSLLLLSTGFLACSPPGSNIEDDLQLWVVDQLGGSIVAYDAMTGRFRGDVVELESGVRPSSVALDGSRVMVTDFASGELLAFKLDSNGPDEVIFENGPEGSHPRLEEPCAVRVIDGETWVLGNDSRNLLSFDGDRVSERVDAPDTMRNPHSFEVSPDGWLYVVTSPVLRHLGLIQVWDPYDMKLVDHFGPYGELEEATALVFDLDGSLIVADYFGNQIVRYDTETGRIIEVLLDEADGLDRPVAMEMGPMGGLYVLDRRALLRLSEGPVEELFTHEQEGLIWPRNLHLVSLSSSERLSHPSGEIEEQLHRRF